MVISKQASRSLIPNAQSLLSVAQAVAQTAYVLGTHPHTVRRWSDMGILPNYRIGSRGDREFAQKDVDDFLAAQQKNRSGISSSERSFQRRPKSKKLSQNLNIV